MGTDQRFECSGDGNPAKRVARHYQRISRSWSEKWTVTIRPWGEERIADELSLKLGVRVSPRTVRKYLNSERPGPSAGDQRWATFVRNHAKAIVACDFLASITATFQILYVFVAMEIDSRRILHLNVTAHPAARSGPRSSSGRFLPIRIHTSSSFTTAIRFVLRKPTPIATAHRDQPQMPGLSNSDQPTALAPHP
jgi:hypothetical protein